jgi:hypothetical protein
VLLNFVSMHVCCFLPHVAGSIHLVLSGSVSGAFHFARVKNRFVVRDGDVHDVVQPKDEETRSLLVVGNGRNGACNQ